MQRIFIILFGLIAAVMVAACNANSDAVHVVESKNQELAATIASYDNMGATVTAEATKMAEKLATAQLQLTAVNSQVRDLTSKMNSGVAQSQVVSPPSASTSGTDSTPPAGDTQQTPGANVSGTGLAFATVVTAKGKDNDGCANGAVTAFNSTDPSIWVVADVRNYKRGTVFTAKWAGGDWNRSDTWTATSAGAQICVHFYIQPQTLALQAGTYTVTMMADDVAAQPVQFTIQAADTGGNSANNPTDTAPTQQPS